MTTPPSADDDPEPSPWAPPDAPASDVPAPDAPAPGTPTPGTYTPGTYTPGAATPYPAPPFPPGPPYQEPVRRRTNQFAIFALVTGLVGMAPLAVGFAITALVQAGRRGERGHGLAAAGLAASAVWVVAAAVLLVALPFGRPGPGRADARRDGLTAIADLDVGDCFTGLTDDGAGGYRAKEQPCTRPHEGEVIARSEERYSDGSGAWAEQLCGNKTEYLQRSRYREDLEPYYAWSGDDARTLTCLMSYTGTEPLTTTLAGTVDTSLKTYDQLNVGECIDEWEQTDPFTATVSCKKPHRFQVYAKFTLRTEDSSLEYGGYPGEDALDKKAGGGCSKRADKLLREHPVDRDLQLMYVMPAEDDWYRGVHDVVCLLSPASGKLKKSLVP
ncbi:septum formation family protein [Actinomadura sp.]|uniref:DUF4190 domain-containing protein n=1 Tax=Actinomadura sp. TaxID=1989 RepID=UPI0033487426